MKTLTVSIVIFVVSMGLTSGAYAQQQSYAQGGAMPSPQQDNYDAGGAMPPAQDATPADFSEADLQKFTAAQKEIEVIRKNYTTRLENAGSPDKALELQQEAGALMMNAVINKGLEVETYNNIVLAMGSNADLRKKLEAMQ